MRVRQDITDAQALLDFLILHAPRTFHYSEVMRHFGWSYQRLGYAKGYMNHNLIGTSGFAPVKADGAWRYGLTNHTMGAKEDTDSYTLFLAKHLTTRASGLLVMLDATMNAFPRSRRNLRVVHRHVDNALFEAGELLDQLTR